MAFENKGSGSKGGSYLICDNTLRKLGCQSKRWRYRDFEAAFLTFVEELDIDGIVSASAKKGTLQALTSEVTALQGQIDSVSELMHKSYALLDGGGPVEFVNSKLKELEIRRVHLLTSLQSKTAELDDFKSHETRYRSSKAEIKQLVEKLQSPSNNELFKIRAQIASQLKSLVSKLLIGSVGEMPSMRPVIDQARSILGTEDADVIAYMAEMTTHPRQSRRFFAVSFHENDARVIFPDDKDPLRYEQQAVATRQSGLDLVNSDGFLKLD